MGKIIKIVIHKRYMFKNNLSDINNRLSEHIIIILYYRIVVNIK